MPIELLQIQNYFKFVTGRDKMELSLKKEKILFSYFQQALKKERMPYVYSKKTVFRRN